MIKHDIIIVQHMTEYYHFILQHIIDSKNRNKQVESNRKFQVFYLIEDSINMYALRDLVKAKM